MQFYLLALTSIIQHDNKQDIIALRTTIGMVFQKPNPFPKSIYDNVAYGPRSLGIRNRKKLDEIIEDSLKKSGIMRWS